VEEVQAEIMTAKVIPLDLAEIVVKAQSASSGAQDALSHQLTQETYNERNSD
jgi:hypothetical protein